MYGTHSGSFCFLSFVSGEYTLLRDISHLTSSYKVSIHALGAMKETRAAFFAGKAAPPKLPSTEQELF